MVSFPTARACHVPFYLLQRVLAAASPLRAISRQCQAAHLYCWLLPKSTVDDMCAAPQPWSPARPISRVLWWPAGRDLHRMQAFKRGRGMLPQALLTAWQKMTAAPHLLPRCHPRPLGPMPSRVCPAALCDCPLLAIFYAPAKIRFLLYLRTALSELALKHVSS